MTDEKKSIPTVSVTYARNGSSTKANALGMRPMFVIDEAVERIKNGSITDYVYDPKVARLVRSADPSRA